MARQYAVPGGFVNETNAYEYATPYGYQNETVAAAAATKAPPPFQRTLRFTPRARFFSFAALLPFIGEFLR